MCTQAGSTRQKQARIISKIPGFTRRQIMRVTVFLRGVSSNVARSRGEFWQWYGAFLGVVVRNARVVERGNAGRWCGCCLMIQNSRIVWGRLARSGYNRNNMNSAIIKANTVIYFVRCIF